MKKLLLLALPMLMFSCSSDSDDATYYPPVENPSGDAYSYMRGTMDGAAFNYTFNLNEIAGQTSYTAITSVSGGFSDGSFSYGGMFSPIGNFDKFIYVSFDNMYQGGEPNETDNFLDNMATLPSNYINFAQDDAYTKGVDIGYQATDELYYSSMGGSQSGSTFVITGASEGTDGPYETKIVTGTFSCKLYNQDDNTDVINITNGTFKIVMTDNH